MKHCSKCGKELLDEAVVCPNCGCPVNKAAPAKKSPDEYEVPKSAKQSKIFGILGILLLFPLAIPAIILANKSKQETGGKMCKQAHTGMVTGIIALVVWFFMLILYFGGM